jgi:hypothetical protein
MQQTNAARNANRPETIHKIKRVAFLFAVLFCAPLLRGQGLSTASRPLDLSAFGGITRTHTGLNQGRNLGVSAGVDLRFQSYFGLATSVEMRGTKPLNDGQVVIEESLAGGIRMARPNGRIKPFATLLFGRTQFNYSNGGLYAPGTNHIYTQSASRLVSPGAGFLFDIDSRLALRGDMQMQFTNTPVTKSRHLISIPLTFAIVYKFPSDHHGHPYP